MHLEIAISYSISLLYGTRTPKKPKYQEMLNTVMTTSMAFHSYKGGTGKTTIAINFAAVLASKGYHVCLLDLDVYAPSFFSYFESHPKSWINDFIFGNGAISDIMLDMTRLIKTTPVAEGKKGRLLVGFSNPEKEEIFKFDINLKKQDRTEVIRRFIKLKNSLASDFDPDYIIIDTSPGVRFWSINALAIADVLFLTLKVGDIDVSGTKKMAKDIYSSLTQHGSKAFLLLNRVAGYCIPDVGFVHNGFVMHPKLPRDRISDLSDEIRMKIISSIPCFCDIQFSDREFLTAMENPSHPFSKQIQALADNGNITT